MNLQKNLFSDVLARFKELKLISEREIDEVLSIFDPDFPFAPTVSAADCVHVHIKVDDTARLPHQEILAMGTKSENEKEGYIKYPFTGGINMIFSSINVSQDELIVDAPKQPRPFVDHLGIDLRQETPAVHAIFSGVPERGTGLGWRHVPQGGQGKPVYCCHVEVAEKHWLYPPQKSSRWTRPIEFAYGALKVNASSMGCDLRPIDPAHPLAAKVPACHPAGEAKMPTHYYAPADLGRFGEVGKFAPDLMNKFFDYYMAATGTDGALTKREKSLIGLAVAHSKQCPYCIDAYTAQCLETGSTPDQMHEAVHVAAALAAGIDLVHGVQMQNSLRARGAIRD